MPVSDQAQSIENQAETLTKNPVENQRTLETGREDLLFQLLDADVLLDSLNNAIRAGQHVELATVAADLLFHIRMIEGVVRHDEASSWSDKRQARAQLLNSFLLSVLIVSSEKNHHPYPIV